MILRVRTGKTVAVSATDKRAKSAPTFKPDAWKLVEDGFSGATQAVSETLFAQANGYLGTRGTVEDAVARGITSVEGTFLNGVFLREKIEYDESAYGYASHNNKMILVPDAKAFRLTTGGKEFVQGKSRCERQTRALDMANGVLSRETVWAQDAGTVEVTVRRFVSMARPGLMATEYTVTAHGTDMPVTLETGLDAGYGGTDRGGDPRAGALSIRDCLEEGACTREGGVTVFAHKVHGSDHMVLAAYSLAFEGEADCAQVDGDAYHGEKLELTLAEGRPFKVVKYAGYADGKAADTDALRSALSAEVLEASANGFSALLAEHESIFRDFWAAADIEVDAGLEVQQGMRFNLFHLFQSAGKDGKRALAAKGLTGAGYDGHYFWDTEIYAVPFFVFTKPEVARALLEYRIGILDKARERARLMAHKRGALFAWRTIGGEECSSYFPAGTAQYHINAAIAYAAIQYVEATGDEGFWLAGGAELLFETARIWMDLGHFSTRRRGRFCINEVTGPDEYTAMADNNLYTNMMAQHHLEHAAALAARMKDTAPQAFGAIADAIGLGESEVDDWARAAGQMYIGYDDVLGIHEQCDGFLDKPEWDFDGTPASHYPLLLHYHPLVIYRHQVLKQPDVVLAQTLLGHKFSAADKARNLAYYEARTTHDSTLSACIHAVANAEAGDKARALEFFEETYRMDIDNRHGNTHYGVHIACMAGSWMGMTYGFAGMRFGAGELSFAPYLPEGWKGYAFKVAIMGRTLGVKVTADGAAYTLLSGEAFTFRHRDEAVTLAPGQTLSFPA
jgi:alpha,alpha-trehalose phosphorylase